MQIRLSNFGPVANCTENRTQGWTVLKIKCSDLYLLILNTNGFACMGVAEIEDIGIIVCIGRTDLWLTQKDWIWKVILGNENKVL